MALATAASAFVNFGFLIYKLRVRVGVLDGRRILNSLVRVTLASAVLTTVMGESTKQATTSTPASANAFTEAASFTESLKLLSMVRVVVTLGFTVLAPSSKALTEARMLGIGNPMMKPSLPDFEAAPAAM